MARPWLAALTLSVIAVGCGGGKADDPSPGDPDASLLLVMTWNAQMTGGGGAPTPSAENLSDVIHHQVGKHTSNSSVVVLNEACEDKVDEARKKLSEREDRDWFLVDFQPGRKPDGTTVRSCDDDGRVRFGNAILATHPAESTLGSEFTGSAQCNEKGAVNRNPKDPSRPSGNDERRNYAGATLSLAEGRKLTVLGSHLTAGCRHTGDPSNAGVREAQVRGLVARGDQMVAEGTSVVIAGDFNAQPDDPSLEPLQEDYRDADARVPPGETYAFNKQTDEEPKKIDYIFASHGLEPAPPFSVPRVKASDHRPLVVGLRHAEPGDAGSKEGSRQTTRLSTADQGVNGSVQAFEDVTLLTPTVDPDGEIQVRFHSEYEGTVDVALCRLPPRGPVTNGCGVVKPQAPTTRTKPPDILYGVDAFLGEAGSDSDAYADAASDRLSPNHRQVRTDAVRHLFLPVRGSVTRTNLVTTEPVGGSHYGRVHFKVVSDGELVFSLENQGIEPGSYWFGFRDKPSEGIIDGYSCGVCPPFPWFDQGSLPMLTVTGR